MAGLQSIGGLASGLDTASIISGLMQIDKQPQVRIQQKIVVVNIDNKLDEPTLKQAAIDVPFVGPDNRAGARTVGGTRAAIGPGRSRSRSTHCVARSNDSDISSSKQAKRAAQSPSDRVTTGTSSSAYAT